MTETTEFKGFPGSRDSEHFPGAWRFGVNFATEVEADGFRVIAVHVGGSELKYGLQWIGPIDVSDEVAAANLETWAEAALREGGYVHLFAADGDERGTLASEVAAIEED